MAGDLAPLLEIRKVSRVFSRKTGLWGAAREVKAVDEVGLVLGRGETLGLVGESGSGKSTVARMAVRLLRPSSGDVLLDGVSIFSSDKKTRSSLPGRLQMIFQDPYSSLNPRLRVGASIAESLACAGMPRALRREKVGDLLRQVGLEADYAGRYPHEFSGGQRQRMAVARALAPEPDLVVCDEPVSSLDASVQAQVLNLLKDTQERLKLSYLFISHDLAVVSHMSDRVAVMYAGRIMEYGPAAEIFTNPRHPYTRKLLEASSSGPPSRPVSDFSQGLPLPPERAGREAPFDQSDQFEQSGQFEQSEQSGQPGQASCFGQAAQFDRPAEHVQPGRERNPAKEPGEEAPGCAFLDRCPERGRVCAEAQPELLEVAPGHYARCPRNP